MRQQKGYEKLRLEEDGFHPFGLEQEEQSEKLEEEMTIFGSGHDADDGSEVDAIHHVGDHPAQYPPRPCKSCYASDH